MTKCMQLFMAAAVAVGLGSTAQASVWTGLGVGDEFSTTGNWDDGGINGTQTIDTAVTVDRSVDNTNERMFVEGGATVNVSGIQNDNRSGNTIRNFLGNNSAGTVNLLSGDYQVGHLQLVGSGSASGNGTFNHTGGDFSVYRGGNSFMGVVGGSSMEIGVGSAVGAYTISAGSLETRIGVGVGAGGTFDVAGSTITSIGIGTNGSLDGSWTQDAGGILRTGLDAGGITPILIDVTTGTGDGGGNATFAAGSILDPYDLGSAPTNVWTTVMTWEGALSGAPTLSASSVSAGWLSQVSGSNLQVQLVAVPEPGSLAILGLGCVGLVARRRRQS